MAKVTTPQNIPSEILDEYRATLGEVRPDDSVLKRYPYRIPTMQTKTGHPSPKQLANRTLFNNAVDKFNLLSQAERERWYATMPEWGSLLWYYNWFMLNAIPNLWGVVPGGAAILKSIQFKTIAMPAGAGEGQVAITAVDINKTVVMLNGASVNAEEGEAWYKTMTIYPYLSSIATELVKCKWCVPTHGAINTVAATISIIVIEYI